LSILILQSRFFFFGHKICSRFCVLGTLYMLRGCIRGQLGTDSSTTGGREEDPPKDYYPWGDFPPDSIGRLNRGGVQP